MTKRGVIVSHTVSMSPGVFSLSGEIPPEVLRRYVLYWDMISYPMVNGLAPNVRSCTDLQALLDGGILTLDPVEIDVGQFISDADLERTSQIMGMPLPLLPHILAIGQVELANRHKSREEIWSVAQVAPIASFGPTGAAINLAEIGLHNVLPTPSLETPIEEVLAFKDLREDELLAFRVAMEDMRNQILDSADPERAVKAAAEVVKKKISDIDRTLNERGIAHHLETLKLYLNPSNSKVLSAYVAALIAGPSAQAITAGVAVGMAVDTLITFGCRLVEGAEKLPPELRDFVYLYEAQSKLT